MATQSAVYDALLEKHGRQIAEAFRRAVRGAARNVNIEELSNAIAARDNSLISDLLGLSQDRLFPLLEAIRNAFNGSGMSVEKMTPQAASFNFDGRLPRAEQLIAEAAARLVQNITSEQMEMVREVLADGLIRGRSSKAVARDLVGRGRQLTGGAIGLTRQQAQAAIRARDELEDLSSDYFRRKLRDRRFDKTVRKAIKEDKPLSATQIERIVGRYRDRMEGHRALGIAQNETRGALSAGRDEGFRQALDRPGVEAVTKRWVWNDAGQQNPRIDHQRLSQAPARPFDQDFVMEDGTTMSHPHDPEAGPEHTMFCRCTAVYRVIMETD